MFGTFTYEAYDGLYFYVCFYPFFRMEASDFLKKLVSGWILMKFSLLNIVRKLPTTTRSQEIITFCHGAYELGGCVGW